MTKATADKATSIGDEPSGIYTQKQLDFVNGLPDDPAILKDQLLHITRLLDLSRHSLRAYEKECNKHIFDICDLREYIAKLHVENPDSKITIPRALMLSDIGCSANIEGAKLEPSATAAGSPVVGDKVLVKDVVINGESKDGVYTAVSETQGDDTDVNHR